MPIKGTSWVHRGDSVRIGDTPVGKGVFAERNYPVGAVVGEITGELVTDCPEGSNYAFEIDERTQLEPFPPFRYLNHSCDPNCDFDWLEEDDTPSTLYVTAIRDIREGEEVTIDYNWPADCAIPCRCGAPSCRGWIVSIDELDSIDSAVQRLPV